MVKKYILIILGILFLVLGAVGILVPGLPTTPFIILSAALFIRSSDNLYFWLKNHKLFGKYTSISKGISLKLKLFLIVLMWTMIFITIHFVFDELFWKIVLVIIGLIGTTIKILIPTKKN